MLRSTRALSNGNYRAPLKALVAECGSLHPSQLRPRHVHAICAQWSRLQQVSRRGYHQRLAFLLRKLEFEGAPLGLSASVPRIVQPSPRSVTATDAERTALLLNAPLHLRLMLLLCSDLALRSGTARNLAPCHYDRESRQIATATKGGRTVMLPVTDAVARILAVCDQEGPRSHTPFLQLLRQEPTSRFRLDRDFARLKKKLGIRRDLRFHDLRRTTALRTYELTKDIRVVQALLGHAHLNATMHYLDHHITPVPRELLQQVSTPRKDFDS